MEDNFNSNGSRRAGHVKGAEIPGVRQIRSGAQIKSVFAGLIAAAILLFLAFYFLLVPLNPHDVGIWILGAVAVSAFLFVKQGVYDSECRKQIRRYPEYRDELIGAANTRTKLSGKLAVIPVALIAVVVLAGIAGAEIFHAEDYASILQTEDAVFEEDLAETLNADSIALMDTSSAKMLGDREIGALSNVVSQYNVSDAYMQIDYNGKPKKVAALDYAGFFKWRNNKNDGVPGYVMVDPVSMSASYQECSEGMVYVPSAYFGQDAARYIWKHYPTELFYNVHFEVDEQGNPYYVAPVYKKTISLFSGETIKGAIVLNPVNGDIQYYDVADIPQWVDVVFDGDLICKQYNWNGKLQSGFINSAFGKKGCKQVTTYNGADAGEDDSPVSDYGYVSKDGDIWIYTGITSVNGDSSNIGFLLANERTGESHYYAISGADEKSAMAAAEGEVQEKRYQASFPSLINVDGEPTYIMVLKDASGLVKLYATVNVSQYNLVATASTQAECISKYRVLIGTGTASDTGSNSPSNIQEVMEANGEVDIVIADIKYIDIDGNTYIYLISEDRQLYRAKAAANEEMLLLQVGDAVHLELHDQEILSFK